MSLIFREFSNDQAVYKSVYELNEYKIDYFQPSDVIIDVGAHIGSFSLLSYDRGSRNIYSYESNRHNFAILDYNTKNYPDIKTHNYAVRGNYKNPKLGSKCGPNINQEHIKNYGGICVSFGDDVDVISLEDIIQPHNYVKLLKLDCEGSEYSIILESPDSIFDKIEMIVGEFHGGSLPVNQVDNRIATHNDLLEKLERLNYSCVFYKVSESSTLGKFFCYKK